MYKQNSRSQPKVENQSMFDYMKKIANVREYTNESVDNETLLQLFEGFRFGPSLANHQPWEILMLDNQQKKLAVKATLDPLFTEGSYSGQPWIENVPIAFVVMIDLRRSEARIGTSGVMLSMQDLFSAIQNLRLIGVMNGLATSVVREFDVERLKTVLQIPKPYLPAAIITVGYPKDEVEFPPLLTVDEFVHEGRVE